MNSTLIRTATHAPVCVPAVVDSLVLPAAVAAPSALVIAVQMWPSQEPSALSGLVAGTTGDVAAHGYAQPAAGTCAAMTSAVVKPAFRTRNDNEGSPPRGTPV